jgi:hypothetical protein
VTAQATGIGKLPGEPLSVLDGVRQTVLAAWLLPIVAIVLAIALRVVFMATE